MMKPVYRHYRQPATLVLAACLSIPVVNANPPDPRLDDYLEMPLEALMNLEVSSVSRKTQRLSESAAAVYVVTQEDIRRSGAGSIPELLRMVPGLNVARVDANKWAISARGFNGLWSNKLLVLMDGRSVYTPLFAGTYWDVQDTLLDDIERIEVIRGPGATLWGANAVNGVINIISKSAEDTQGGLVKGAAGNQLEGLGAARYGGEIGDRGHYRVYVKAFERDDSHLYDGGDAHDGWRKLQMGFRTDWARADDDFTLQGVLYQGENRRTDAVEFETPPYRTLLNTEEDFSGGNLLARWSRAMAGGGELSLKVYYDRSERDNPSTGERRDTFDLDLQRRLFAGAAQELVWGIGYRFTRDDIRGNEVVWFEPQQRHDQLFSAFLQDEITLVPDRWRLILGSKIEHNDYSGVEIQPNARLLWTPDDRQTVWASVSRAVRSPARADQHGRWAFTIADFPLHTKFELSGSDDFDSETLIAYEAGYRIQANRNLHIDVAVFFNDYQDLRAEQIATPLCQPSGTPPPCFVAGDSGLAIPATLRNRLSGHTHGLELAVDWRPREDWQLRGGYSLLRMDIAQPGDVIPSADLNGSAPRHQVSLRSLHDLRQDVQLDLWLRYVDQLPALDVADYLTLDTRLAWRPRRGLELSLVGRNLLQPRHGEFVELQNSILRSEVERSAYVQATLEF